MGMRSRGIEIAIDELVLHGLDPSDRDGIREIIERELGRLFAERGMPPEFSRGGQLVQLDGARIEVEAGSRAAAIGVQVAQSLYHQVAGSSRSARRGRSAQETREPSPKPVST